MLWRRHLRRDFGSWCEHALAPFDQKPAAHHRLLISHLQDVADGKCDRLMVLMPPGHAKSTYSTILFPCWWFTQKPRGQIISASYNQEKADEFSGMILPYVREHTHALGYGLTRERIQAWNISTGGTYRAVGIGGPVTGRRADLIIIDDPVKGQKEADSETIRNDAGLWYSRDLYTRLKPGGAIILCQTRWHDDDLAGRLLAGQSQGKDKWRVINLPALAESDDPLGRELGAALWPEWQDLTALKRIRLEMGDRGWSALYQQKPRHEEGAIIKSAWWKPWTEKLPKPDMTIVSLDTAYTEKDENDPSACTVWDVVAGNLAAEKPDFRSKPVLVHAWAKRLEFPELIEELHRTVKKAHLPGVPLRVLIEGKASGISVEQELRRRMPDLNIFRIDPRRYGEKRARAHAVTALFEAGAVHAVAKLDAEKRPQFDGPIQDVIDECAAFPLAKHDDRVDTVTMALRHIRDLGLELFMEDSPPPASFRKAAALY